MNSRSNGTKKPVNTVADLAKAKAEVKRWEKEVRLQRKNLGAVPQSTQHALTKARMALRTAQDAAQTTQVTIPGAPKLQNRVWIELDKPRDAAHADELCKLANNMIQRLNPGDTRTFWYEADHARYCFGSTMGYVTLSDRGEWFNLDFLGRPLDMSVEEFNKQRRAARAGSVS